MMHIVVLLLFSPMVRLTRAQKAAIRARRRRQLADLRQAIQREKAARAERRRAREEAEGG